jgi:hypothetical protein
MSAVVARSKGGIMAGIVVDRVYERRLAALVNSREQRLIVRGWSANRCA